MKPHSDYKTLRLILNSLRWRYTAKDHGPLKHLNIFQALYDGGLADSQNLIAKSWGKAFRGKKGADDKGLKMTSDVLDTFEDLFTTVV